MTRYYRDKCPVCGYQPKRKKDGSPRHGYTEFIPLYTPYYIIAHACPECGILFNREEDHRGEEGK